jgi:hypothetical protein
LGDHPIGVPTETDPPAAGAGTDRLFPRGLRRQGDGGSSEGAKDDHPAARSPDPSQQDAAKDSPDWVSVRRIAFLTVVV